MNSGFESRMIQAVYGFLQTLSFRGGCRKAFYKSRISGCKVEGPGSPESRALAA